MSDVDTELTWENAETGEPGDQNAESRHLMEGATSAFYSLGPAGPGRWTVDLVQIVDEEWQYSEFWWMGFATEAAAKAAAAELERSDYDPDQP